MASFPSFRRALVHGSLRLRAAPAKPASKSGGKKKEAKGEITGDRINIYVNGKDPVIGPDSDYPPWLFEMMKPPKILSDIARAARSGNEIPFEELLEYKKKTHKLALKEANFNSKKA
eukprot:GILK01007386.1.p1 GENE.GILK01007386.1~~GILK01007386.1.p1  ORF type:complete len:117 (+),score=18.07 GILK01007386.1:45-395(+)